MPELRYVTSPLERWALEPAVLHLNHGSFGACLRSVLAEATAVRARVEAAAMRFYRLEWQGELDRARAGVAAFVGADPALVAFVPSATSGVALALNQAAVGPADEILTTSHGYPACMNQLKRFADARGARVTVVETPLPFDADQLVERCEAAISGRTKLALLDHITSPTALVYPLARLLPLFAAKGIPVIVDGAHAPGQVPVDVRALQASGATYYVGNHHKWMCAPKASAFLAVAEAAAGTLRPLVTSHGATPTYGPANRLHAELDWPGTYEPSSQLAVTAAIRDVGHEAGGWDAIYARNHALVLAMRDRLGGARLAPDAAFGSMVTMPITLPVGLTAAELETRLLVGGCEVPIVGYLGSPLLRISAHLYNQLTDVDDLARRLHALGARVK